MAGMLTLDQLKKAVGAGEIDTVLAVQVDMQGRLMGKRFQAEYFLERADGQGVLTELCEPMTQHPQKLCVFEFHLGHVAEDLQSQRGIALLEKVGAVEIEGRRVAVPAAVFQVDRQRIGVILGGLQFSNVRRLGIPGRNGDAGLA